EGRERERLAGSRPGEGFVPSRGDEPYIHRPKDRELAAACTRVLNDLEFIEERVWDAFYKDI
ncbi:hypothetical protein LCGC14_3139910, partial [marine sediment metagenome]